MMPIVVPRSSAPIRRSSPRRWVPVAPSIRQAKPQRTADVATFTSVERWREAMGRALYAPGTGFFVAGDRPAGHFRTSVHASPLFAAALARLLGTVDDALGRPARFRAVDVGAGRGELLVALAGAVAPDLGGRLRPTPLELAPRPCDLPASLAWRAPL